MKVRAVIFDIYKTLLDVGPPPPDAAERWKILCEQRLGRRTRVSLKEMAARCERLIAAEHGRARRIGIVNPEIFWPDIARGALKPLAQMKADELDSFLFEHAQLQRTLRLMNGAAETLCWLRKQHLPLGLISNSQPYTLRELEAALRAEGLERAIFQPALCCFSFENGFSKPNPHAFRMITIRLAALGISPRETLHVGDRIDNDIEPARLQGWHTWELTASSSGARRGNWPQLFNWLRKAL
jgi:FMN phosphatase YigB (HAD superfamily)